MYEYGRGVSGKQIAVIMLVSITPSRRLARSRLKFWEHH